MEQSRIEMIEIYDRAISYYKFINKNNEWNDLIRLFYQHRNNVYPQNMRLSNEDMNKLYGDMSFMSNNCRVSVLYRKMISQLNWHFNNDTSISLETKLLLDIKIKKLYLKVGKLFNSINRTHSKTK